MTGRSPDIESSSPLLPFSPTSATGWSLSCISVMLFILLYGKAIYFLLFVLYRCIIVTFYIWSHNSFLFAEHELEYVILDWINMLVNHNLADIERLMCVALKENLRFRSKPHILFLRLLNVIIIFFIQRYNDVEMKKIWFWKEMIECTLWYKFIHVVLLYLYLCNIKWLFCF